VRYERPRQQVGVELTTVGGRAGQRGPEQPESLAHGADGLLVGDHDPAAAVGRHPGQLAGSRQRVHRYGDDLRPQHPEVGRDELDPVAERQQHPLSGHEPGSTEPGGDPGDLVLERRPGHTAAPRLDDGEHVGPVGRCLGHERGDVVGHRHRGDPRHSGRDRPRDPWIVTRSARR
jgi:hypothetical protein